tara:strand:- start:294 stop:536 length:243 start_codon:yes stop_codon:yes gene_type:complete
MVQLMDKFLFFNILISALNIFVIIYAYSYGFFPEKWRNKVKQGTIIGLTLILMSVITMFSWVIYFYYLIFEPLKKINSLV